MKVKLKVRKQDTALLEGVRLESRQSTISEVAAGWHEPMIPQCIMRPSIYLATRGAVGIHATTLISYIGPSP